MASLRREFGGYGLPSNPSDGVRSRRQPSTPGGLPRPANSATNREAPQTKPAAPKQQHSRLPSRSTRTVGKPESGLPVPTSPPQQSQEPRRMPSVSISGSTSSRSRNQSSLDSSSSGMSYDSSLKSLGDQSVKRRSFSLRNTAMSRDAAARVSASPKRESMASIDQALDIYLDTNAQPTNESSTTKSPDLNSSTLKSPFIYPELDRYRNHDNNASLGPHKQSSEGLYKLSTHDLPPPTPASAVFSGSSSQLSMASGSPSTKFSASPGPGPYSRDTTPTSIASHSPGLIAPTRLTYYSKGKPQSPAYSRPPVTRRRAGSIPHEGDSTTTEVRGLDAVRESVTSSSSNSTVKEGGRTTPQKKSAKLAAPPPSPPPRKSSQKFRKQKEDDKQADEQMPKDAAVKSKEASLSPQKPAIPLRPSRKGTPDLKSQLFEPQPVIQSNLRSGRPSLGDRRGSASTSHSRKSSSPTKSSKNTSVTNLSIDGSTTQIAKPPTTSRPATAKSTSAKPSSSRFNIFSRKKATAEKEEKKEDGKAARKGPAAGTGHEGYGKIGAVRRRSGAGNLTYNYSGPQASQETIASEDSFFADRMNPVIISGGGVVENQNKSFELSRTDSNLSQLQSRESLESHSTTNQSITQSPETKSSLQPSLLPYRETRLYNSSDSEGGTPRPNLALRRSIQRLQTTPDSPLRLPQPINTTGASVSPLTSIDTSILSDESHLELRRDLSQDSTLSQPGPRKLRKKHRSPRKWNFFGRAKAAAEPEPEQRSSATVAATVTMVDKRPVAFYAMMDSSEAPETEDLNVQDVLYDANVLPQRPAASSFEIQRHVPAPITSLPASSSTPTLSSQDIPKPARRPSRLQQVGRIPKVATRYHNPTSPRSFSRPFRASVSQLPNMQELNDPQSIAKGPSPPPSSMALPIQIPDGSTLGGTAQVVAPETSFSIGTPDENPQREFLSFSPRKFSVGTVGTSSSSSGYCAFSSTAIIPKADDPPAEDEVWDEYNDLLGVETERLRQSTTSSRGIPFHLETYHEKLAKESQLESPVVAARKISMISDLSRSSYCSADMTERLKAAFQPHNSHLGTGDDSLWLKSNSGEKTGSRRHSSASTATRFSGSSSSSFDYNSPLAQVNLRVGSMTVSKWLTFGHVLFSDIRHELIADKQDRSAVSRHSILVIDGLGNDDWSFYVAETYPKANFYNLSPRAPLASDSKKPDTNALLSPPNHHQVQYTDHLTKFPFAPQSFDSVVYRFPVAAPESHYRNIIAESRRVLKPGGYLELAILDLDLNNMGNKGRRTIRHLKEMIHEQTPGTSLGSAADILVRLLGNGGFSGIRAAKVGVPVASAISQPRSSTGSAKKLQAQPPPSLSDMMKENGPAADANIGKMVTRVGRWWYTRCYENAAAGKDSYKSIWDDKAFLNECQELGTSLKLTVCCARAPDRVTSC